MSCLGVIIAHQDSDASATNSRITTSSTFASSTVTSYSSSTAALQGICTGGGMSSSKFKVTKWQYAKQMPTLNPTP